MCGRVSASLIWSERPPEATVASAPPFSESGARLRRNPGRAPPSLDLHARGVCPACGLWALCKSPALPRTMRGSATTLTCTALLCLGELRGREAVGTPSSHIWSLRDTGGSVGTDFLGGEGNVLSPDLTPALRAQSRPGASRTCGGAGRSQGTLFQGCAGARGTRDNQVSPQTSCFHPHPWSLGSTAGRGRWWPVWEGR